MRNTDDKAAPYVARLIKLETERRERSEDIKELMLEARAAGLLKEEIAGIKLAAKRAFETGGQRQFRESVEEIAAALGDFQLLPLGAAAIREVARA
jgi:hypothetical protein